MYIVCTLIGDGQVNYVCGTYGQASMLVDGMIADRPMGDVWRTYRNTSRDCGWFRSSDENAWRLIDSWRDGSMVVLGAWE